MPLISKPNYNQVFASQAPEQDKPAVFNNYPLGWGVESRPNNGKPTIKGFNFLQQTSDLKALWILQNGACLPYDATIEYAEGAPVLKDGVIQYKVGGSFKSRDTVTVPTYNNTADGIDPLTGVGDGAYFNVRSSSNESYIDEYQNVDGVPTPTGKSYPSSAALNAVKEAIIDPLTGDAIASKLKDESGLSQQKWNNGVDSIFDLLSIPNPKNGNRIFVKSIEKWYTYYPDTNQTSNGVTVVDKWEMDIQDAYYASWFCAAESGVDESEKLQTGYDYAVSKKRAFIVDIKVDVNPTNETKTALWIRSNSVLGFVGDAEVRMLANTSAGYDVIRAQDVENYVIKHPVLRGDRLTHTGTTGEWGYGLTVYQSKNGYIHRPRIYDMWGDGLYVGRLWGLINSNTPTNVTVFEPYIEGARRNGISFTAGDNVNIIRPYITKVGDYDGVVGVWPKAGIDVEPEQDVGLPKSTVVNSKITSATIKDCYAGVYVYLFSSDLHHTLAFDGITTIDGATTTCIGLFHGGSNCTGLIEFEHVLVKPPLFVGMQHAWNGASGLKCVIDKITIMNVAQFEIRYLMNGDFIEKDLGGLFVNKFSTDVNVLQVMDGSTDGFKLGSVMRKDPNSKGNLLFYGTSTAQYKPEFLLDGSQTHASWSSSTKVYPNTIWQDPSINTAGDTQIFLNTSGDYRRLKIGLSHKTQIVGQGCNINGLNLLVGGVVKTEAHCLTLGGWLDFQNVEGDRTVIYDSYGVWTFS